MNTYCMQGFVISISWTIRQPCEGSYEHIHLTGEKTDPESLSPLWAKRPGSGPAQSTCATILTCSVQHGVSSC